MRRALGSTLSTSTSTRSPGIDYLARMLDAFGPAHFRNMNQTFNAVFEFDERAVISNARNSSIHSRADRKTFFDAGPWIRQQLFVTERDALALAIEFQNLDLNVVADAEQLVRILQTSPRHVSHVQQTIDSAEIDERAVVSEVLDLTFNNDVFFDLLKSLIFSAGVLLFDNSFARQHNVGALAVELDYLRFDDLIAQTVEISHRTHVNLRTGQERSDAVDVNAQSTFDAIDDAAL